MYERKKCIELPGIKNVNTRAPLFKTILSEWEEYKNGVLYKGTISWNSSLVNIRKRCNDAK